MTRNLLMMNCIVISASEDLIRRKRVADDPLSRIKLRFQTRRSMKKNIKKVYKSGLNENYKTLGTRKPKLKENGKPQPTDLKKKEMHKVSTAFGNIFSKTKSDNLRRQNRSIDESINSDILKGNEIDRSDYPEMDEIWNEIVEMKQDEELLREYDRQKDQVIQNFREAQHYLEQQPPESQINVQNPTTAKTSESTTRVNLESMIVDAIPKLETVITGGLEKAENLTGNLEDFIENFDGQLEDTTANSTENTGFTEHSDPNDGRLSHTVFKTVVGSVKKFFHLISGAVNAFHGH